MFGDLLSTAGYTTRRSGRPSHRNGTITPSCLPCCFLPTTLQLLRCRSRRAFFRRQSGADITTPRCCCQERHKNRCKHFRSHRPSYRLSLAQLFGLSVAGAADKLTYRYYIPALSRLSTFARQNQLGVVTRSTMAPGCQGESFKWAC